MRDQGGPPPPPFSAGCKPLIGECKLHGTSLEIPPESESEEAGSALESPLPVGSPGMIFLWRDWRLR